MGSLPKSTHEALQEIAESVAVQPQFSAVEVLRSVVRRERGTYVIVLVIDRESGVDTELCEDVSRCIIRAVEALSPPVIDYRVEVGSAGVERPLQGEEQFRRFFGKKARIITSLRIANRTEFAGAIAEVDSDAVTIDDPYAGRTPIPYAAIKRAHLVYDAAGDLRGRKAQNDAR